MWLINNIKPGLINPKRLFNWGGTISVSYCTIWGEAWLINYGLLIPGWHWPMCLRCGVSNMATFVKWLGPAGAPLPVGLAALQRKREGAQRDGSTVLGTAWDRLSGGVDRHNTMHSRYDLYYHYYRHHIIVIVIMAIILLVTCVYAKRCEKTKGWNRSDQIRSCQVERKEIYI